MVEKNMERTLEERRASAPEKVDQGKLPAGSPITYYCKSCGHITKVNPEDWWRDEDNPPRYCEWCVDNGHAQ